MARKIIDIGTVGNDGTGDSIRDSFRKVNDNFRELYSSLGLGENLTFLGLDDTPDSYVGQNDPATNATPFVTVNNDESGLTFKQLRPGDGISIDYTTNPSEITINAEFSRISADPNPALGGDLSAFSGGNQYRIQDLVTPVTPDEAVNKAYADTKISRAGVNSIDPATGLVNAAMGRMSGPLILSRDPEPDDDEVYGGLIAATKRYVDNSAFGSVANLYVATSGQDDRPGVSLALQGRALAYAYRSIEAACKRAEELVLEARQEIGPYKKVLTYNGGEYEAYLTAVQTSPLSGSGFAASPIMSVDSIVINARGSNYNIGDRLTLVGGAIGPGGQEAVLEVLSTQTTPGAIATFRIISTGAYSTLPGATGVESTTDSSFGTGATFDVTYKVNNVAITNNGGSISNPSFDDYSLVSVRISGGGGSGAFGTADVVNGQIASITVTDQGGGFTSLPTVQADLPRFLIFTNGQRTDYTGDLSATPEAARTRDVREGLYLYGTESGALAQILSHSGELDGDDEIFDVDIKYGTFQIGEPIAYGDVTKNIQISILVESGIYEENLPIKLPQNTSIVGDEFRRCIIRPRKGTSSSPWAFQKFRRDLNNDGLTTATQLFGYHYLQDSSQPVYPKIDNRGFYRAAATLINLNRSFIQEEVIAWIEYQSDNNNAPFTNTFEYDRNTCQRDVGLILDSIIFDLKWGGYNRTISAGLKYYQNASGLIAIGAQLSQTLAAIDYVNALVQQVIDNTEVLVTYQDLFTQIVDNAYIAEAGSDAVINDLINALKDVMDGSGSVNYPKENDQMDMFLANDAVRWQAITGQGHGGFMLVLDPEGQILAKSPYAQECASFSKSINAQTFAGGMFIDGFAGNLEFRITEIVSPTRLRVDSLDRIPQLPCSFIVQDVVYRVNYVRDYIYAPEGSTATLVLDETTPWPFDLFTYDDTICSRDVGLIIDGLVHDIVLGTNYHARKAGLSYRQANAEVVILDQKRITVAAIDYAHELAKAEITGYADQQLVVDQSKLILSDIIDRGTLYSPVLSFTEPPGVSAPISKAKNLLIANLEFIKDETVGYITNTYPGLIYDPVKCARDTGYIVEALIHDLLYGGNWQTRDAGVKYYDGVGTAITLQIPTDQKTETADGVDFIKELCKLVIVEGTPGSLYSATPQQTTGLPSDSSTQAIIETLISDISDIITNGVSSANALVMPSLSGYDADAIAAATAISSQKSSIQASVVNYVDINGNRYELLMPGNRSILCNDYTQVNDLGYGIFATNGGLVEAVSMFTYYCHISYYSLNGAQIRSVGGSSAHGNYALVAEGSDPLEVPTPTGLYYDMAQGVVAYAPSLSYQTAAGDLFVYVTNYNYLPLGGSELEVQHTTGGGTPIIYRYPVTSIVTEGLPTGVVRLNITSDSTGNFDGLYDSIPNGAKMSLRLNSIVYLTGDLVEVSVRPSTGLRLRESDDIYRVLQFDSVSDANGPYELSITPGTPGTFEFRDTITTIASNVITVSAAHGLLPGDKLIMRSTGNNLNSGATYYVKELVSYTSFKVSQTPTGSVFTLVDGSGLSLQYARTHKQLENYLVTFTSTGTLPAPLVLATRYYVAAEGLTETSFKITNQKNGTAIDITSAGTGTHSLVPDGITKTTLRENYNYVDLTVYQPGEFVTSGTVCTISIASPGVISTATAHGLSSNDVIKFESTGDLPIGITEAQFYFVLPTGLTSNSFRISDEPLGTAIDTSGSQTGVHTFGLVKGRVGDQSFAVVPVSPLDGDRTDNMRFVFKGEEYVISNYESEEDTNLPYARVTLNRPLEDSIIGFGSTYTIRAAVPAKAIDSTGSLTIRISLTRVTSHDILEVGTGSYADTNYPNEIYGPSVNALAPQNETDERDVGRVFYVTTDQFGNFSVGPYFRVDQGTGRVTFSAAIALSNLDGIGFKRGVPIAEFSVDSSFSDNATDTVPTENATRIYIERRLGISHSGVAVAADQLIPVITGGFMPLSSPPGVAMKSDMDLGNNKIINLNDPSNPTDAVNLRSLTIENLQNFSTSGVVNAGDLMVFTGENSSVINAKVVGDLTFDLTTGQDSSLNQVTVEITPNIIVNADINSAAGISQSKLSMSIASALSADPSGTAAVIQAANGLASFNSSQFDVANGRATIKTNGVAFDRLAQLNSNFVLGNSAVGLNNVAAVSFATVVDAGAAVKKSNFGQNGTSTGFLRRTGAGTSDSSFTTIEGSSASAGYTAGDASKIVIRDSNGDIGANNVDVKQLKVDGLVAVDSGAAGSGGFIRLYGYNSSGGILLSSGSLAADKVSYYDNDAHVFRPQSGIGYSPITASTIQVTTLTTGSSTSSGTITGRWTLSGTSPNESRLQATYSADLAEYYEGDKDYPVGTVLIFGGDKEVTISNKKMDTKVAGVVSNTAAFVMYDACPGYKNLVALQGRVPCRVVGKISKGDLLVTSNIQGVAVSAGEHASVGTVVGKALQAYDSDHIGTIEIAVGRT